MRSRLVPALLLVVLAAAVLWLAFGDDVFGRGSTVERSGASPEDAAPVERDPVRPEGAEIAGAAAPARAGPVLFGRPRGAVEGPGSLAARFLDVRTGKPAAGARVLLAGTAFGGA